MEYQRTQTLRMPMIPSENEGEMSAIDTADHLTKQSQYQKFDAIREILNQEDDNEFEQFKDVLKTTTGQMFTTVGMNSQVCKLTLDDATLIENMKRKVEYYQSVMSKREALLLAIVNNVDYLKTLHSDQLKQMKVIQKKFE